MKNLFKSALVITVATISFSSCMKKDTDNYDYEAEYKKQEQRLDSLLSAQKIKIEEYKTLHYPDATQDSIEFNLSRLGKKVKRGIWYKVINQPTDNTYTYGYNTSGSDLNYPKLKLKYKVKLVSNDTEVEWDNEGTQYNLGISATKITDIWLYSFFPYSVKFNGVDRVLQGLTKDGLKQGSKFVVITPSIFAYGSTAITTSQGTIPANSPLVYEFDVLEINN